MFLSPQLEVMINTMLIFKEYEYAYKCYAYKKYRSIIIEKKSLLPFQRGRNSDNNEFKPKFRLT